MKTIGYIVVRHEHEAGLTAKIYRNALCVQVKWSLGKSRTLPGCIDHEDGFAVGMFGIVGIRPILDIGVPRTRRGAADLIDGNARDDTWTGQIVRS